MWDTSSFGDTAANGFFNDPNQFNSPSGKTKGQARRHQNALPVVIRQIRDCPDEFRLFGMETQIFVVVGILREYEVQSTKAIYEIEDHTGGISAIYWLENDTYNTPNLPVLKEGCYVRIFGSLRNQDGKKMLMILKIFPVDDINIVTNHLLQVIHARLEAEDMNKGPRLAQIKANNPGAELVNSMSFMQNNFDAGSTGGQTGLSTIQEKVFRILQSDNTPTGLSRHVILKNFAPNQHREVNNALEFLNNEGHAYTTIDHDHFKITDSM